jgi:hypothetical protein
MYGLKPVPFRKPEFFRSLFKPVPFEGRVNIESEWAARKRERAAEQPHSSQKKA